MIAGLRRRPAHGMLLDPDRPPLTNAERLRRYQRALAARRWNLDELRKADIRTSIGRTYKSAWRCGMFPPLPIDGTVADMRSAR